MFFRCITKDMAAILNSEIIECLPADTYLAGGTAIALYFGHRLSIDLDFFTHKTFDSLELATVISKKLKSGFNVTTNNITENTLVINLNDTGFSIFTYPYPLLNDSVPLNKMPIHLASHLDLALMKLIAINQRGTCKDFIDLKYLTKANNYTFKYLVNRISEKYVIGGEIEMQLKKSLVYFVDAEHDLNIQMYSETEKTFELLKTNDWLATKLFYRKFVLDDSQII
ncbi:nucleotidyl transferase AbiEii/AbiGii toxin family protein [Desulfococcaceae bacterium HSG7]|nr:nucleotidyl transferase AbiEii/AbiGii toxin family protein [Desulfococcaceae bacterium HSG7]